MFIPKMIKLVIKHIPLQLQCASSPKSTQFIKRAPLGQNN